jgi:hypothetical protein
MAFGQAAGPPASPRQLRELQELVEAAGHRDFRDARGPLGLNQRQAAGRFTRDEADVLIAQLDAERDAAAPPAEPVVARTRAELAARTLASEDLAAELRRRGWTVLQP